MTISFLIRSQQSSKYCSKTKEVFTDRVRRFAGSFLEGANGADLAYHRQLKEAHLKSNVTYFLRQGSRASCYPPKLSKRITTAPTYQGLQVRYPARCFIHIIYLTLIATLWKRYHYLYVTDKETKAQRSKYYIAEQVFTLQQDSSPCLSTTAYGFQVWRVVRLGRWQDRLS